MPDWESLYATRSKRMQASEIRELLKLLEMPGIISFAGGIPDPKLFPEVAFQSAYNAILAGEQSHAALQYSVSEGYKPLRAWLVKKMQALGVACTIDNIVITSGSQQALDYLGKLLLSPNDTALVTWPTYLGALQAFNAYEPHYEQLNVAGNRTPQAYKAAAEAAGGRVKFAYMSADFTNPTGMTVTREEREKMLDLTEELDVALIEDAAYQDLRYDGEAIPPILALDIARCGDINKARTIYCGSFSKTLAPGLRIGWVCAAEPVIRKLVLAKQAADLHTSTTNQIAMAKVAETIFDEQVAKICKIYKHRRDKMLEALARYMPKGVSWTKPEGGMFIWVTLPERADGATLLARSLETVKVAFVPGKAFYADGSGNNHIRLSFSCADDDTIDTGIRKLGEFLAEALHVA